MSAFTDQSGRTLILPQPPRRIVSLVPSQTELLYTLGLDVVGITKFCVHPESWFRQKTRVGGTKDVRLERVHSLRPDLIIANKEENDRAQVEELARHYPVWVSHVKSLPDALGMIRSVGELTGRQEQGKGLAEEIDRRFRELQEFVAHPSGDAFPPAHPSGNALPPVAGAAGPRTAYFIWRNPWMAAGGDTFIHDMLRRCGFTNLFGHLDRYPSIDLGSLAGAGCGQVLLSSEPYPFRERHIEEIRAVLPDARIRLVDGELFSWYGSRLLQAPAYFRQLAGDGWTASQ
jgi:ABC-type Fe3+-hydroxamate transport system substrate-binding protein